MSDKLRRFTAWVALFFMIVFTVVFVIYLSKPDILQGRLVYLATFCFVVGLSLFVVIRFNDIQHKSLDTQHNDNSDTPNQNGNK
ncbi:MAG: hypothetical protein LBK70_01425 [Clostridiales bacterium]|jgi:hypothetical protein|nr:hypothetical protein [Clostridiales bacterium]